MQFHVLQPVAANAGFMGAHGLETCEARYASDVSGGTPIRLLKAPQPSSPFVEGSEPAL